MNWLEQHGVLLVAAYWVFSAAVGAMPPPTPASSTLYLWLHGFLHILAGNIAQVISSRFPAIPEGTAVETVTLQHTTATGDKP